MFEQPEENGVFLNNNNDSSDVVSLTATGKGFIYIVSEQGMTICWETVYTPNGSGTVLSPDRYLNNNSNRYFSFQQYANQNNNGYITFIDKNNNVIDSITMLRICSGQCLMKNQVIIPLVITKHIIQKVTT